MKNVQTLLDFMTAAQTLTAIYGSPDGPIEPERYYEMMSSLLDDPNLIAAQAALTAKRPYVVLNGVIPAEQPVPLAVVPKLN